MVRDKVYKEFNVGDEVYTEKVTWKAITANKPYIVLACYKPEGYVDDYPVRVIELKTDIGFISRYATDKFIPDFAQFSSKNSCALIRVLMNSVSYFLGVVSIIFS